MTLSIIVAVARDGAIGQDNKLLWHLPADLKRFKAITSGHSILMGRNTWHSLPNGALPNRRNIVISRTLTALQGAEVYPSVELALQELKNESEVFVIGGAALYRSLLPQCTRLYLTQVHAEYPDADTYFPNINWDEWHCLQEEHYPEDERNPISTTFSLLERK